MSYHDLRDFVAQLEDAGELRRITEPVSRYLEIKCFGGSNLRRQGPF